MTKLPKDITSKLDARNLQIDPRFQRQLKHKILAIQEESMAQTKQSKQAGKLSLSNLFKYNFASLATLLALVIVVGGVSATVSGNRAKDSVLRQSEVPSSLTDVMSVDDIRALALKDAPGATIMGIELEQEDEGLLYKVKFADGTVRFYDAKTGELVTPQTKSESEDESVPAGFSASVTLQEARDIAQQQRPGKIINKIELESEHGVVVYSVRFTDGGRVDVDASNGNVLRVRNASSSGSSTSSDDSSDDSHDDSNSGSGSGSDDGGSDDNSGHGDDGGGSDDNSGSGSSGHGGGN